MTEQIRESLQFSGREFLLLEFPLEPLFEISEFDRPDGSTPDGGIVAVSSCWRRYIGLWKIEGGALFLLDARSPYSKSSVLHQVFLGGVSGPHLAWWFSGRLHLLERTGGATAFELDFVEGKLKPPLKAAEPATPQAPLGAPPPQKWKFGDYLRAAILLALCFAYLRYCSPAADCDLVGAANVVRCPD